MLPAVEKASACLGPIGEDGDCHLPGGLALPLACSRTASELLRGFLRWFSVVFSTRRFRRRRICLSRFKWCLGPFLASDFEQYGLPDLVSLSFGVRRISNGCGSAWLFMLCPTLVSFALLPSVPASCLCSVSLSPAAMKESLVSLDKRVLR